METRSGCPVCRVSSYHLCPNQDHSSTPQRPYLGAMFITTARGLPGRDQGLQTRGCSEVHCLKCSHLVPAFLGFRESLLVICVVISLGVCGGGLTGRRSAWLPRQSPSNTTAASSNQQNVASAWRPDVHSHGIPRVGTSPFGL